MIAAAEQGDFGPMVKEDPHIRKKALQDFFDLCERDADVKRVMVSEGLNRTDLEAIYDRLIMVGAGQWSKGHFVPLWALAHEESLRYIARASSQGIEWFEIASDLVMYRRGEIAPGTLSQRLKRRSEARAGSPTKL